MDNAPQTHTRTCSSELNGRGTRRLHGKADVLRDNRAPHPQRDPGRQRNDVSMHIPPADGDPLGGRQRGISRQVRTLPPPQQWVEQRGSSGGGGGGRQQQPLCSPPADEVLPYPGHVSGLEEAHTHMG